MQSINSSLLILNDYCLYKILDYLNFKDQIKFLILCERLQNVYVQYLKGNRCIKLELYNNLDWPTFDELKYALNIMGPTIEEFLVNLSGKNLHWFYECFEYILNNCIKLKRLEIQNHFIKNFHDTKIEIMNFNKFTILISEKLLNLKYLKINDLHLTDDDIKILSKSKIRSQLQYLDVSNNKDITGKYLENFINLKTLKMAKCCHSGCKNLINLFQNLINLKHLDLEYCYQLSDSQIGEIINYCKNLVILKFNVTFIGGHENLQRLHKLENLKSLTVIESARGSDVLYFRTIFNDILKKFTTQLIQFKMYFSSYDYDKGLNIYKRFDIIKNFEKLYLLHLDGYIKCDEKFWSSLEILIIETNLKILIITFKNDFKEFNLKEFVNLLIRLRNSGQITKINLEINEEIIITKNFLKKIIQEFNLYKDQNVNFNDDNFFTLSVI